MTTHRPLPLRSSRRTLALAPALLAACSALGVTACLNRPIEPLDPRTTEVLVDKLPSSAVSQIDLLLMIDNSASMADKQDILADAVPKLVSGLLNPLCLDDSG